MNYHGPRNRGGWPAKRKTIFDPAALRLSRKALDILDHAQDHVIRGEDWCNPGPTYPAAAEAWNLLGAAKLRVHDAYNAANAAAAKRERA